MDRVTPLVGATYRGLEETERSRADANASLARGLTSGLGILTTGGAIAVPLLATGPVGVGTTALVGGGGLLVRTLGGFGAASIEDRETEPETDSDDLAAQLEDLWRERAVEVLVEDEEISPPSEGDSSGRLGGYVDGDDPFDELAQSVLVNADRDAGDQW
ncbi:hypothetical protein BH24ACT4_BH24ACT4_25140 [soil metagenome]